MRRKKKKEKNGEKVIKEKKGAERSKRVRKEQRTEKKVRIKIDITELFDQVREREGR